jgi:hypothetical protein
MGFSSPLGVSFVVYLVTAATAIRAQGNIITGSIFLCFPQFKLGQVTTSYIPTNGTRVTGAADVILTDVYMSMFRLYGVRDYVGPMGRRNLLGADGPAGAKGDPRILARRDHVTRLERPERPVRRRRRAIPEIPARRDPRARLEQKGSRHGRSLTGCTRLGRDNGLYQLRWSMDEHIVFSPHDHGIDSKDYFDQIRTRNYLATTSTSRLERGLL